MRTNGSLSWVASCLLTAIFVTSPIKVHAQSLGSGSSSGEGGLPASQPGGAAMADFDTLINLIQQTIDPDSWVAAGGSASILPYPQGVYVDPKGRVQHIELADFSGVDIAASGASSNQAVSSLAVNSWRRESSRRTVSLRSLDRALQASIAKGLPIHAEIRSLAGLSKIDFVKIDVVDEDILISGPSSNSAASFLLEDLAVVASHANANTEPFGCSIDPSENGLVRAKNLMSTPAAIQRLARSPKKVAEEMQAAIGPHNVRLFGISGDNSTALALLDADEHMKQVGFGTVETPVPIRSYFDFLELQPKVPSQSLIRWWFSFSAEPIRANSNGDLFQLPKNCVAVLSEQQWITAQGRVPTGGIDPAADAFAKEITDSLDSLRETLPSYGRLHAVYELSLAMQLTLETTGQPSLQAWFPTLCGLGREPQYDMRIPETVSGLTTTHRLKNGTTLAVVSGGVTVNPIDLANSGSWQETEQLSGSSVPTQPTQLDPVRAKWWWD